MNNGYVKLYSSLLTSTLWLDPDPAVLRVWIAMLLLCDKDGIVESTSPGLAALCQVPVEKMREAEQKLLTADPDSRTKDNDGKRIERIEGGWRILNYWKYRVKGQDKAGSRAGYMRQYRERQDGVTRNKTDVTKVTGNTTATATATATEAEIKEKSIKEKVLAHACLKYLNEKTGRHYRELDSSLKPITARLQEAGVTLEGVKTMIDRQVKRWKGTPMEEYLRPETLFGKTKFNSYYAAKDMPIQTETKPPKRAIPMI